ncbi:MAG: RNA polymerase sigma factor [Gemmatimonadota bacterium]
MAVNWAEVYEETAEDLVRFVYRKVWDLDAARDLVQEAFVRALSEEPKNPRAWLFAVARNLARDEAKKAIRRRKREEILAGSESSSAADPVERLEGERRATRVRRALGTLSSRDREALLLRESGLGYEEIAAHTGLSAGSVGTTLSRARQRFLRAYEALEDS